MWCRGPSCAETPGTLSFPAALSVQENVRQAEVVGQTFVVLRSFAFPAPRMLAKNCCCSFIMSPAMSNHAVRTFDMSGVPANASPGVGRRRPGAVGHLLQGALHAARLPAGLATVTELAAVSVPLLAALPLVALLVAEVLLDPLVSVIAVSGLILATRPLLALLVVGVPLVSISAVIPLVAVVAIAVAHQVLLAAQVVPAGQRLAAAGAPGRRGRALRCLSHVAPSPCGSYPGRTPGPRDALALQFKPALRCRRYA